MTIEIISPEKLIFKGESGQVNLPGISGSFSIMDHHAPIISVLGKGNIVLDSGKSTFPINKGMVEVLFNKVVLLVED